MPGWKSQLGLAVRSPLSGLWKEVAMIRMFARHTVSDFDKWKQGYDSFDKQRREMGVVDNPNDVTVWHDFDTLESAREFAGSKRLREAMSGGGVVGKPEIWFTTAA
jgi:hypothetical protein